MTEELIDLPEKSNVHSDILLENVILPIKRTLIAHSTCIFRCDKKSQFVSIPDKGRVQAFNVTGFYVPRECRSCEDHFDGNRYFDENYLFTLIPEDKSASLPINKISFRKNRKNYFF